METNTWKKLQDGTWGIAGIGLKTGDVVSVVSKGGESQKVVVGEVVARFNDTGKAFARVARRVQEGKPNEPAEAMFDRREVKTLGGPVTESPASGPKGDLPF